MNWEEKLSKFPLCYADDEIGIENEMDYIAGQAHFKAHMDEFIRTEIIEKLIDEIPDFAMDTFGNHPKRIKAHLKAKWLGDHK